MRSYANIVRALVWLGVVLLVVFALQIHRISKVEPILTERALPVRCVGDLTNDFSCHKAHVGAVAEYLGQGVALADLKRRYAKYPYVYSQCHQLSHVIGNVVAERATDISDAFIGGDSICWSGYYHGVVERYAQIVGREYFRANADRMCLRIPDKERYGFDYYNCVHGLGHGVMAIARNDLFDALGLCKNLSGEWEKRSCYGGVFMENVMVDNRGHGNAFLRPDDLLYPCNVVDGEYKEECYKMQTSYALTKNGYDFQDLFKLCLRADPGYTRTCAQSIGRDASGQSVSNVKGTMASCALALNDEQETDCYIGAVKDYVSYFHSDLEARVLCSSIPPRFAKECEEAMLFQWATMNPAPKT